LYVREPVVGGGQLLLDLVLRSHLQLLLLVHTLR
jgi:hypothetical protein